MSAAIGAGDLHHRLTLEMPIDVADGGGGTTRTWQQLTVLWGAVRGTSGRSATRAGSEAASRTHDIIIRYRTDIASDMRFRLGARLFRIIAIADPDGRAAWLVCNVVEEDL
ncbi:MAG: phage head closure protein [Pseudomonadota bacterium]